MAFGEEIAKCCCCPLKGLFEISYESKFYYARSVLS
jgi:hypothetical protein